MWSFFENVEKNLQLNHFSVAKGCKKKTKKGRHVQKKCTNSGEKMSKVQFQIAKTNVSSVRDMILDGKTGVRTKKIQFPLIIQGRTA